MSQFAGAADEAISRLANLEVQGRLTPEQAAAIKADLQQLVNGGQVAIPAIRQFLEQNQDFRLDEMKGGSPVGHNSLRAGLFDALQQIGGADAQEVLIDVLQNTADPAEIRLLAKHLDGMAPGLFHEQFLSAARETLAFVSQSKIQTDVGPLFQVLRNYGGPDVVHDLEQILPEWRHYGLVTLAGLPGGEGIPMLIEEARQLARNGTAKDPFAVQMLAQVAPNNPQASAALIEQARDGRIPESGSRRVADALAGYEYQFPPEATPAAGKPSTGATINYYPNQTLQRTRILANEAHADLATRLSLVDQLLDATSNPTAIAVLQRAKTRIGKLANTKVGG